MSPKRILHVITGLNTGGAEMTLFKLLSKMNRDLFEFEVISLTNIGPVGQKIKEIGIPVASLGLTRRWPNPFKFYKLIEKIKKSKPDLIQTWMYHADLIAGLAARFAGPLPILWNVRHSNFVKGDTPWSTRVIVRLCAYFSRRIPTKIIGNSQVARRIHIQQGYPNEKMHIIPNGFDLDIFKPDSEAYRSVRAQLNLSPDSILIGLVGRFHPQKDHFTFIQSALKLARKFKHVYFVLCGDQVTWENPKLRKWIGENSPRGRFFLLGKYDNIPQITAALDIAASSSLFGEGFSNTIGEAMACGVPCVVTNIGDSAFLVDNTGLVVRPSDPDALSEALERLVLLEKKERAYWGQKARERMKENFGLSSIVGRYENLYREMVQGHEPDSTLTIH